MLRSIFLLFLTANIEVATATTLDLAVDLSDLPRNIIRSEVTLPVDGETLVVRYPNWIPGAHAPAGRLGNIARFDPRGNENQPIKWERDQRDPYRFHLFPSKADEQVKIYFDYIANQSDDSSEGADSHCNGETGIVSWNNCLVYPEGKSNTETRVKLRFLLPSDWHPAVAMDYSLRNDGWTDCDEMSLRDLIDRPLICGKNVSTETVSAANPKVQVHVASDTPGMQTQTRSLSRSLSRLVSQTISTLGPPPFEEYHFLIVCSNTMPWIGLEHANCSLNVIEASGLYSPTGKFRWGDDLLPHEFVHAWCGKYRRPQGMIASDYHTPKVLDLLWVYEGLTEYLGEVLTVRAGLQRRKDFEELIESKLRWLMNQQGRRWRSLSDTARSSWHVRSDSRYWQFLRRSQDYYDEGMLYWMEADAIIRDKTNNEKSLDDFCRSFFGYTGGPKIKGYASQEIYDELNKIVEMNWGEFFQTRVVARKERLPLDLLKPLGYRIEYRPTRSTRSQLVEFEEGFDETISLGLIFSSSGVIFAVVPGSPVDVAGIKERSTIWGVNGEVFSSDRLRKAIANSSNTGRVELLMKDRTRYEIKEVAYDSGARYLHLVEDPTGDGLIRKILTPYPQARNSRSD